MAWNSHVTVFPVTAPPRFRYIPEDCLDLHWLFLVDLPECSSPEVTIRHSSSVAREIPALLPARSGVVFCFLIFFIPLLEHLFVCVCAYCRLVLCYRVKLSWARRACVFVCSPAPESSCLNLTHLSSETTSGQVALICQVIFPSSFLSSNFV